MNQQIMIREAESNIYWKRHETYMLRDIIPHSTLGAPLTEEDKKWFLSAEYRDHMDALCRRDTDRAHRVLFFLEEQEIGFCYYCTYASEDGKCFLADFCIYPEYRGQGLGARCFQALKTRETEAAYFELNLSNDRNRRFWSSLGFAYNGYDRYGSILCTLLPDEETKSTVTCEELEEHDYPQLLDRINGYKAEIGEDFPDGAAQERLLAAVRQQKLHFLVLKRKTRIIGMCSVCPTFSTYRCETGGIFEDFFIEPVFRKKGLAHRLTAYTFGWCRSRGITSLWVGCAECDTAMYRQLGFRGELGNLLAWESL